MLKHIEKQKREAARIRLALKGKFEGGLTYVLIPSLSAYSHEVQNDPAFHIQNMDFIWDRVQIANGHDIDEWDIVNDKESVERLTLECLKNTLDNLRAHHSHQTFGLTHLSMSTHKMKYYTAPSTCLSTLNQCKCIYLP